MVLCPKIMDGTVRPKGLNDNLISSNLMEKQQKQYIVKNNFQKKKF